MPLPPYLLSVSSSASEPQGATADDMISVVAFSDFGTVDQDVSVDKFRASAGFGVRVVIPAMGPVPLAFDFAFPIRAEAEDDERIFSFYVGINR